MKKINLVVSLSFLIVLLFVTPVIGLSDWVKYETDDMGNVLSYNRNRIKHRTKNIIQVWTDIVFSDEGRQKYVQIWKNNGKSTEGYNKLFKGVYLHEIDCKNDKYQSLSVNYYDTDGTILLNIYTNEPKWSGV